MSRYRNRAKAVGEQKEKATRAETNHNGKRQRNRPRQQQDMQYVACVCCLPHSTSCVLFFFFESKQMLRSFAFALLLTLLSQLCAPLVFSPIRTTSADQATVGGNRAGHRRKSLPDLMNGGFTTAIQTMLAAKKSGERDLLVIRKARKNQHAP